VSSGIKKKQSGGALSLSHTHKIHKLGSTHLPVRSLDSVINRLLDKSESRQKLSTSVTTKSRSLNARDRTEPTDSAAA
jgi:hypothetical protein